VVSCDKFCIAVGAKPPDPFQVLKSMSHPPFKAWFEPDPSLFDWLVAEAAKQCLHNEAWRHHHVVLMLVVQKEDEVKAEITLMLISSVLRRASQQMHLFVKSVCDLMLTKDTTKGRAFIRMFLETLDPLNNAQLFMWCAPEAIQHGIDDKEAIEKHKSSADRLYAETCELFKISHPWDDRATPDELSDIHNAFKSDTSKKFHMSITSWVTGIAIMDECELVIVERKQDEEFQDSFNAIRVPPAISQESIDRHYRRRPALTDAAAVFVPDKLRWEHFMSEMASVADKTSWKFQQKNDAKIKEWEAIVESNGKMLMKAGTVAITLKVFEHCAEISAIFAAHVDIAILTWNRQSVQQESDLRTATENIQQVCKKAADDVFSSTYVGIDIFDADLAIDLRVVNVICLNGPLRRCGL